MKPDVRNPEVFPAQNLDACVMVLSVGDILGQLVFGLRGKLGHASQNRGRLGNAIFP